MIERHIFERAGHRYTLEHLEGCYILFHHVEGDLLDHVECFDTFTEFLDRHCDVLVAFEAVGYDWPAEEF